MKREKYNWRRGAVLNVGHNEGNSPCRNCVIVGCHEPATSVESADMDLDVVFVRGVFRLIGKRRGAKGLFCARGKRFCDQC